MNRKSIAISLFIAIISCAVANAMFTRSARVARQQVLRQQTQRRLIQTHQQPASVKETPSNINTIDTTTEKKTPLMTANTGIWSYWTAFKNKIFGASTAPIAATVVPATPVPVSTAPITPQASPQQLISWIDAIKILPEAKTLLQKLTQTALNDINIAAHLPSNQWTNLIEKQQKALEYIQHNCLTQSHPNAKWDNDIPEEIVSMLHTYSATEQINPESFSAHYRDTINLDPFGHDAISVTGPTILYKTDATSSEDIILGYEPATITIHRQNISKLTKSQCEAKIQHAITHLKHAHTEQLALLQKAIGNEKYEQYAQPYKQALENEADLLEPIKNAAIAKVVQHAFLEEALDDALKNIKQTREKLGLHNTETGLMMCAPPGDLPQFLFDMNSFDDIKKYIYEKKEAIVREYLDGDEEFIALWKQENNENYINYLLNEFYTHPTQNTIHDKALPAFILDEAKKLLIKANINPACVNILSKKNYKQFTERDFPENASGCAVSAKMIKKDGKIIKIHDAMIAFDEDYFKGKSHAPIIFVIAHEIGHVIRAHSTIKSLQILRAEKGVSFSSEDDPLKTVQKNNRRKDLLQAYDSLYEIEADITYAMLDASIAKTILSNTISRISKGSTRNLGSTQERGSLIHASTNERYHWIKKIVELHQKEEAKKKQSQPLFAPERE